MKKARVNMIMLIVWGLMACTFGAGVLVGGVIF
jgi:hypothetical protein